MGDHFDAEMQKAHKRIIDHHRAEFDRSKGKAGPLARLKRDLEEIHGPLDTEGFLGMLALGDGEAMLPKAPPGDKGAP